MSLGSTSRVIVLPVSVLTKICVGIIEKVGQRMYVTAYEKKRGGVVAPPAALRNEEKLGRTCIL